MSIDFTSRHPPAGPVVLLDGVCIDTPVAYDVGMDNVSLHIDRGDLAMIKLETGVAEHPLADLLSGLVPADRGTVRVFGLDWATLAPDLQAKARWRIGRVFAGHGWLSNLDIDENITLSERYHTSRPATEITAEAERLATLAGMAGIPEGRPALAERNALRRAEWVRSAMGEPWLVILELPGRGLSEGWIDDLKPFVRHMREAGTAVIWLCSDDREWNDGSLNATLKISSEGNKLIARVTT